MRHNVFAFPARPRRPDPDLARLERALVGLLQAVSRQATVTREYSAMVKTLDASVQDLGSSVTRYRGALASLDSALWVVGAEAQALAVTADRASAA